MEQHNLGFVSCAPRVVATRGLPARLPLRRAGGAAGPALAPRRRARVVALGGAAGPPPSPSEENGAEEEAPAVTERDGGVEADKVELGADDILSSPVFLKKKLEVVMKELNEAKEAKEAAEEAFDKEKDGYVRLVADFENYRRRSAADLLAQDAKATAKVCKEILGVLDNFERAILAVTAETEKEKGIDRSYQAINGQLLAALVKLNVTPVEAVGEVFNPEMHDAIQRADSDEYAEGVVCTQFQRGYMIGETLIRPAMVVVSAGPGPEAAGEEAGDGEDAEDSEAEAEGSEPETSAEQIA